MRHMNEIKTIRFVLAWSTSIEIDHGFTVKEACNRVGISESQYYKWRKEAFLKSMPVFPRRFAEGYKGNRTPRHIEELVIVWAESGRFAHATELSKALLKYKGVKVSPRLVRTILKRAGTYGRVEIRNQTTGISRFWYGIHAFIVCKMCLSPPYLPPPLTDGSNLLILEGI